jgi:hypothetical protein
MEEDDTSKTVNIADATFYKLFGNNQTSSVAVTTSGSDRNNDRVPLERMVTSLISRNVTVPSQNISQSDQPYSNASESQQQSIYTPDINYNNNVGLFIKQLESEIIAISKENMNLQSELYVYKEFDSYRYIESENGEECGIIISDNQDRILTMNNFMARMLGIPSYKSLLNRQNTNRNALNWADIIARPRDTQANSRIPWEAISNKIEIKNRIMLITIDNLALKKLPSYNSRMVDDNSDDVIYCKKVVRRCTTDYGSKENLFNVTKLHFDQEAALSNRITKEE